MYPFRTRGDCENKWCPLTLSQIRIFLSITKDSFSSQPYSVYLLPFPNKPNNDRIICQIQERNLKQILDRKFRRKSLIVYCHIDTEISKKVISGITGLKQPRVRSNVAFWSFMVDPSYHCKAEFAVLYCSSTDRKLKLGFILPILMASSETKKMPTKFN